MARVPLAGTDWIPQAPERCDRDRGRRHRRRRHRGCRRGVGAEPTRRHRCRCCRTQHGRLRDDRKVQRHRPLPLRRQLAGGDGHRRPGGVREGQEIFGTDIGFRQTGYVVGVGEANVDSLRKSLAAQRAVGVQTEEIDHAEVAPAVAVRRPVAVRRVRLGGARRVRRRVPDRAGVRGVGPRRRGAGSPGHQRHRPARRRRPGHRRPARRRQRDLGGHRRRRHRGMDPAVPRSPTASTCRSAWCASRSS